ncbi:rhomboid family intramembrane serine protease [Porticoccus sp.]|jgi:GlpG protein|nr:rhomboid family intramembrane serine protease [Cellvibrionales bacterium]MBT7437672.1 rhomboid family intramembrane serine protease [Cellvibrionales bacterium]MDA7737620.1 rhomboid family intramembrane serine protease [Porticoccus sp.]MDA7842323.1 rhomboid family intramembrane serine protease [Porticoccus sp.]MDC0887452.1 rhomboid family intramembrane serine protease [Porticoccus sp.]
MRDLNNLSVLDQLRQAPIVFLLLVSSFIGTGIVEWMPSIIHYLTIQDFLSTANINSFDSITISINAGEVWRLVTPIFLHFSIFHLIFNSLLLWILGQKIEYSIGSLYFFMSVFFISIISNLSQYLLAKSVLFGGLSGLVYGLLGFIWISYKFSREPIMLIPQGLFGFMLVWLFLGISGIVEIILGIQVANAAHTTGLISGMILGCLNGYRFFK